MLDMPHSVSVENDARLSMDHSVTPEVPVKVEVQAVHEDIDMGEADWNDSQKEDGEQGRGENGTDEAQAEDVDVAVKAEKVDMKLADLFTDMDSDEEFPSSNIKSSPPQPSSPPM